MRRKRQKKKKRDKIKNNIIFLSTAIQIQFLVNIIKYVQCSYSCDNFIFTVKFTYSRSVWMPTDSNSSSTIRIRFFFFYFHVFLRKFSNRIPFNSIFAWNKKSQKPMILLLFNLIKFSFKNPNKDLWMKAWIEETEKKSRKSFIRHQILICIDIFFYYWWITQTHRVFEINHHWYQLQFQIYSKVSMQEKN